MSQSGSPSCGSCKTAFGFFSKGTTCGGCEQRFCGKCCYRFLLLERDDVDLTVEADDKQPVPVCNECFVTRSSLDYSTHVDKYGTPGSPGLVVVHGNMATRKMFAHFARVMVERHGPMRIYAIDLPKHGTRYEEEMTMETAVEAVREAVWEITKEYIDTKGGDSNRYWAKGKKPTDEAGIDGHKESNEEGDDEAQAFSEPAEPEGEQQEQQEQQEQHDDAHAGEEDVYVAARPFVMGYSMGGYITIAVAAAAEGWKRKIAGAIVGGAGANMNAPGMGLGLSMFNLFAIKMKSAKALSVSLQNQFPKIPLHHLQECFYRVGTYHDVWPITQKLLTGTDYCAALAKVKGPLLVFRGAKDFKDADKGYLKAAPHAQLLVIPKGDHMCFMHFVELSVDGIHDWMSSCRSV